MPKKSRFREYFDKQHGKRAQALLKSASHHLYDIHWSLERNLGRKQLLLLTCKTLGLLVNALAADEKYPLLNRDNLTIITEMQSSQKQNTFYKFFASFLKSSLNFKYFEQKMTVIDFAFSKLQTPKT